MWSIQQFENIFLQNKMERNEKESDWWRGSDMGGCMRKRFYQRKGIKKTEPITDRQRRTMDVGSLFHWKYQRLLKNLGILIEKEGEIINEKYHFKGHFDALVGGIPKIDIKNFQFTNDKDEEYLDETYLLSALQLKHDLLKEFQNGLPKLMYDLKTQHSQSFQYIEKKPQDEHVWQLCSYLVFSKEKYPDILEGRLLYISKDDSRLIEFPVKLTPEIEQKVYEELDTLNQYWQKDELPPQIVEIENNRLNWKCSYCPYLTHCRGEGWAEKTTKLLTKKVKKINL